MSNFLSQDLPQLSELLRVTAAQFLRDSVRQRQPNKRNSNSEIRALSVLLLPVRTSVGWFHDYVWGHAEVRFIRGRINFSGGHAPFDSMLAIYKPS